MAKKRSNGEGTLRQRPNGIWELTIMDGFQHDGRRKYKSFYAKTQKEVKARQKHTVRLKLLELMQTPFIILTSGQIFGLKTIRKMLRLQLRRIIGIRCAF